MRRAYLVLAGFLGAAVAVVPGLAAGDSPPPSASFTAVDYAWQANGGPGNAVTVAQGGTVSFGYPTGSSAHNADFGTGPHPSSCVQSAGASSGSVPPVPNQPTSPGWSGSCTFNTPGTYTFHCDLHPYMTGTIVVQGTGTTTSTTSPTTTTATTTTNSPTTNSPTTSSPTTSSPTTPTTTSTTGTSPAPGAPASISIAGKQRGPRITGAVRITAAGAGGRLEVDLGLRGRGLVRVGRLVRQHLPAGTLRFKMALDARGARALRRRGALTLTVLVTIRSPQGETFSSRRQVRLSAA